MIFSSTDESTMETTEEAIFNGHLHHVILDADNQYKTLKNSKIVSSYKFI